MDETTSTIIIAVLATGLLAWAWWLGQFPAFAFRFAVFGAAFFALWVLNEQAFARLPDPWGMIVSLAVLSLNLPVGWWTIQPLDWGTEDLFAERWDEEDEEEEPAPTAPAAPNPTAPDPAQVIQANVQALTRRRP